MQLIEPIIKVLLLISTKIILFDYCQITLSHLKYTWMRDASYYAIGSVLLQQGNPIAYESLKLNETKRPGLGEGYASNSALLENVEVGHNLWSTRIVRRRVRVSQKRKPSYTYFCLDVSDICNSSRQLKTKMDCEDVHIRATFHA